MIGLKKKPAFCNQSSPLWDEVKSDLLFNLTVPSCYVL